jgi:hypothetical protein
MPLILYYRTRAKDAVAIGSRLQESTLQQTIERYSSTFTVDCEIGVRPKLNVLIFTPRFADALVLFCAKSQRHP